MSLGYQSEVGKIRQILLKHARDAFVSDEMIGDQWQGLNYLGRPDLSRAIDEYDRFVELLQDFGTDIHLLPSDDRANLDSIYVRDASVSCNKGMILCKMGKVARNGEPAASADAYQRLGIPIHGAIVGEGRLEGGDVVWLDERTLIVGRGYRTNDEGIRQLRQLLQGCADEVIVAHLPHWHGPGDVFHLMSILSPIDHDLALVYSPLMPVALRETLLNRGINLVEVHEAEFETMGCNALALAPRQCLMLAGNPKTKRRLEAAGVAVFEYDGGEISLKGAGGPTCLTRPLLRQMTERVS